MRGAIVGAALEGQPMLDRTAHVKHWLRALVSPLGSQLFLGMVAMLLLLTGNPTASVA
jgi:hypothetical protein